MFKFRLFSYKKLFQEQQKQLDAERQNKKVIQDLLNAERYKTSKFTTNINSIQEANRVKCIDGSGTFSRIYVCQNSCQNSLKDLQSLKKSSKKYQSTINEQEKELEELKAELLETISQENDIKELKAELLETTSKYKELDKRYSSLEDIDAGRMQPITR